LIGLALQQHHVDLEMAASLAQHKVFDELEATIARSREQR
jgi:hypothetical protein